MQHAFKPFAAPLPFTLQRLAAFGALAACAVLFTVGTARADEYADVNQLLRQGQAAEALAKADAYIAGKPRDPQMRFLRGVILTQQGKQAEATDAFVQITQEFPELPEPYNNLAALYAGQSEFDKARAALETAIKLNPSYATAHENLGDVYVRLAAQSYARAQQLQPGTTSIAPKLAAVRRVLDPAPEATGQGGASTTLPATTEPVKRSKVKKK